MQDLDQKIMKIFTKEVSASAKDATQKSGIDKLLPGVTIDDFLFNPCGYSMNGLLKGGYYITIHITPEPLCSYVSFETNIPQVCNKLLSLAINTHNEFHCAEFRNYCRTELQFCRFKNYDLTYTLFAKAPS
ncbi:S-adenosylmethionine decarboxylase proenzyme-like [Centruroides vittatus]|uniref:S-adenosylmethionine decarboxylase proenzyme-like n=1 Tax=Centruroides vittatus TaxID=120091 RepID=UPI00350F6F1E